VQTPLAAERQDVACHPYENAEPTSRNHFRAERRVRLSADRTAARARVDGNGRYRMHGCPSLAHYRPLRSHSAAELFYTHVHLHGGPAPVAEGYRALDERRAIKTLLRPDQRGDDGRGQRHRTNALQPVTGSYRQKAGLALCLFSREPKSVSNLSALRSNSDTRVGNPRLESL
jgi:hypothetical protein